MFSVEFINELRTYEIDFIQKYLVPGSCILEIGGGTGIQARELSRRGYDVVSVDLEVSSYTDDRVYPIIEFDGINLPFSDDSFDIILSSNVLEHVLHRERLYSECERVLATDGYHVHVMPTGTWRFWTNIANYVDLVQRLTLLLPQILPRRSAAAEIKRVAGVLFNVGKLGVSYAIPSRHGETGNALTEIWTFSRAWWLRHFRSLGYRIEVAQPMGLFYTGHTVFGNKLSMPARVKLARYLGSSCVLYKVSSLHP